ncbi:hypothetical protein E2P81_ATG05714 [Venturia nashicola]|uniref:Uncharacterized protein n=1 Tax=Venturia nashicola TaxID=86259 RepID=A0A4Z1NRI9_9PEZI|nr:hypothetical protein E6O75_ATG05853 [Venturia nashicola]TLD29420.1 hypothetical protein E2P81_ATG05714 [Venturia nashicola]
MGATRSGDEMGATRSGDEMGATRSDDERSATRSNVDQAISSPSVDQAISSPSMDKAISSPSVDKTISSMTQAEESKPAPSKAENQNRMLTADSRSSSNRKEIRPSTRHLLNAVLLSTRWMALKRESWFESHPLTAVWREMRNDEFQGAALAVA